MPRGILRPEFVSFWWIPVLVGTYSVNKIRIVRVLKISRLVDYQQKGRL